VEAPADPGIERPRTLHPHGINADFQLFKSIVLHHAPCPRRVSSSVFIRSLVVRGAPARTNGIPEGKVKRLAAVECLDLRGHRDIEEIESEYA
jgi:hypothetical protein